MSYSKIKKVTVYIDESELNGNIILGALIVPNKNVYEVSRKISSIRKKILSEMIKHNYPILDSKMSDGDKTSRQRTERIRLSAGGLPEIHAAELWTSTEVFWKERDGTEELFDRHIKWIRESLSVIASHEISLHLNLLPTERQEIIKNNPEKSIYDSLSSFITPDISRKKVEALQQDNFVRLLFGFMQSIEKIAQINNYEYDIVCDKGKKNEFFTSFVTFDTLRKKGCWQRLQSIDFQHSHDNPLIQLCDTATYVAAKDMWLDRTHRHYPLSHSIYKKYLERYLGDTPMPGGLIDSNGFFRSRSLSYAELMAMLTEMAMFHCGGRKSTIDERKRIFSELMDRFPEIFYEENGKISLIDAALQPYKPSIFNVGGIVLKS